MNNLRTAITITIAAGVLAISTKELVAGHGGHLPPAGVFNSIATANSTNASVGGVHYSAITEVEYAEPASTAVLKNEGVTVPST